MAQSITPIPDNEIIKGYTAGKEFTYKKSGYFYIGHYYKYKNKYYAGKTFDITKPIVELVDVKKVSAANNPNSFLYNVLAGARAGLNVRPPATKPTKSQTLASIAEANKKGFLPVADVSLGAEDQALQNNADEVKTSSTPTEFKRYFYRRIIRATKEGPEYKIGEISEDEYNFNSSRLKPPAYITAIVTETRIPGDPPYLNTDELDKAEKKIPGLKVFLGIESEQETV